jgi:hypothetical protein
MGINAYAVIRIGKTILVLQSWNVEDLHIWPLGGNQYCGYGSGPIFDLSPLPNVGD